MAIGRSKILKVTICFWALYVYTSVCMWNTDLSRWKRYQKFTPVIWRVTPSALRSSKLIRCKSTRKQHSFLTFKGCLVDNIPAPGLKSIETILLVDNDFPRKSIGFSGPPLRNLKSACSFSTFFMIGDSSITTGEALMAFLPLKGLSVKSMTSMLVWKWKHKWRRV